MEYKKILICFDRDGTINYDGDYFLGSQPDWKNKVKIMPGVISGLKKLQKLNHTMLAVITNQSGTAIKNFPLLNIKRTKEVGKYIMNILERKGIHFTDYETCNYISLDYVKTHPKYRFNMKMVKNHPDKKPKPGMIKRILKKHKLKSKNAIIYVVGDRATDVQTALNINGFGILVPTKNRPKEIKKTKKLNSKKTYIAKSFIDACNFIIKRENQNKEPHSKLWGIKEKIKSY